MPVGSRSRKTRGPSPSYEANQGISATPTFDQNCRAESSVRRLIS